jgi:hypothetical protein
MIEQRSSPPKTGKRRPQELARSVILSAVCTLAGMAPVSGQDSWTQLFVASVFDEQTGEPVVAAFVAAVEQDVISTTDRNGSFRLNGLRPGSHTIRVWRVGYVETEFSVDLGERQVNVLDSPVVLKPDPVYLPEIVVDGSRELVLMGPIREFYRRRREGRGTFLSRTEIETTGSERFEELLRRLPGVEVIQVGDMNYTVRMAGGRFNGCRVQFWVDGIRVDERWAMALRPEGIEGIEVYRRLSEVPPEFSTGALCGVIAIWTRR